jgi:carboxypeptidase C (cathepsin A)
MDEKAKSENGSSKDVPELIEEMPVVTQHEIRLGERTLKYTVTAGRMPLKNNEGKIEAQVFFIAYTKDDAPDAAQRPLMFSFNGGPGSASVWLHLGVLGPKRVQMLPDGGMPAPPYRLIENEATWLDLTDLVFIDPVGTGYSRPRDAETGKKFWSVQGDVEAVGEFIRLYLTRYQRWASPLFLVGESYGTTRAAGLAGHLIEKGIAFNGILLVSSVLNFQTLDFDKGNDLPYALFLPTFTATAWYHKRLAPELQADLQTTLEKVEHWVETEYVRILAKGDRLSAEERETAIAHLAHFTGLQTEFIDQCDLRITQQRFCKELLRSDRRTVGRLDSRFKGLDALGVTSEPDFDPSMAAIRPPYTAAFNHYIRAELNYESDLEYYILGGGIGSAWNFSQTEHNLGYTDTSEALRSAFVRNTHMRLFVASGYYDLATPYFATEYTLSHMGLDSSLRGNIATAKYEAGHMMYIQIESLAKLKADVADFLRDTLQAASR